MAQEFGNVGVRSEDNNENLTECPDRVDAKKGKSEEQLP